MGSANRIKVIVPIPMDAAGVANRAQQRPAHLVGPGFVPEFTGVPRGAALAASYHDMLSMDCTVFQAVIKAGALLAIEADGADVIVPGSTTMHQSEAFLADALPVPVFNPGQVAWKTLEMLIGVNLSHGKSAFPTPEVGKDDDIGRGWA